VRDSLLLNPHHHYRSLFVEGDQILVEVKPLSLEDLG
jgi:hypothetical protein